MTTTTNAIDYRERIKQEYRVSDAQLDACERWERSNGTAFYTVQSATIELTYYRVEWDAEHHCVRCLPHSGERCKGADAGYTCWHMRAALASERLFKYEQAQAARREAEAIEAEPEHREEQACFDLEAARLSLEAAKREASATKRDGARAYSPRPFSLLK